MCKIPAHSPSPWCNDRHRILSPKGQPACLFLSLWPRAHGKPWDATLLLWDCEPGTLLAAPFPHGTSSLQPWSSTKGCKSPIIQPCDAPHTAPSPPQPQSQPRQLRQTACRAFSGTLTKLGNPSTSLNLTGNGGRQKGQLRLPHQNGNRAFRNLTGCIKKKQGERHTIPARFRYAQRGTSHLSSPRVSRSLTSVTPEEGSASAMFTLRCLLGAVTTFWHAREGKERKRKLVIFLGTSKDTCSPSTF